MNSPYRAAAMLTLAMLAGAPGQAEAGLLGWLDQLSGPGPFAVFDASFGVKCSHPPADRPGHVTRSGVGVKAGCQSKVSLDDRNLTWFLSGGVGFATKNPLHYDDGRSHPVRFVRAGTSLDYTVHRALDIGAGAGVLYFNGPQFANFTRAYVEPVRLGVRPLVFSGSSGPKRERRGALLLYVNWSIIPGTLDGRDFGAPSDPFRARTELDRKEIGASLDIGRLFFWKD